MYYNHLVTSDNTNIYPCYMEHAERLVLREKLLANNQTLYCSCSIFSEKKLEYGMSTDGKFYPLHQGYEHSPLCARAGTGKRASAFIAKEDGTATAYLGFNIATFTVPQVKEEPEAEEPEEETPETEESPRQESEENAETNDTPKKEKEKKEEKEPLDSLGNFVLQLNNDTQKERTAAGKGLLSADYFQSAVTARLKKVYIEGIRKPIKDITVNEDGVQFFYLPFIGMEYDGSYYLTFKGWKSDYRWFTFGGIIKKEMKLFEKRYGISLIDALNSEKYRIMAAGFRYLRLSRRDTPYKVVGRIHIFLVSENGLYCRDMGEVEELNLISKYMQSNYRYKTIIFERIIDDERIFGIFSKQGKKQVVICKPSVPKRMALQGSSHTALATGSERLTEETLRAVDNLLSN